MEHIKSFDDMYKKYGTEIGNIDLINRIKYVCYDFNRDQFVPKRGAGWLLKNHNPLYNDLVEYIDLGYEKIPMLVKFLIYNKKIPKCSVCGLNDVIIKNFFEYHDICSNKCAINSEEVQTKTNKTCSDKYGQRFKPVDKKEYNIGDHHLHKNYKNLDDVNDVDLMTNLQRSGKWENVAEHFGLSLNSHASSFNFMRKHGYDIDYIRNSRTEEDLYNYVCDLVGTDAVIRNTKKVIPPYELDIYIPSKKIAIEFNGIYWHSSNSKKDDAEFKLKHKRKTDLCEDQGIQLLHIFENEWVDTNLNSIWKSTIKSKLGLNDRIYARKCIVKDIDTSLANDFCLSNHLQGSCGASTAKGLYYKDELVMVATLGKPRYNKNYNSELLRLCTKQGLNIVGGASKILKGIKFISYANRRWSHGNVYHKLNMKIIGESAPCYWYVSGSKLYHRSTFMKHKLKDKLSVYDPDKTEVENMYINNYRRIWDCGNLVFVSD